MERPQGLLRLGGQELTVPLKILVQRIDVMHYATAFRGIDRKPSRRPTLTNSSSSGVPPLSKAARVWKPSSTDNLFSSASLPASHGTHSRRYGVVNRGDRSSRFSAVSLRHGIKPSASLMARKCHTLKFSLVLKVW